MRPPDYDESSARRDHQASAAVIALHSLGFAAVDTVRAGKYMEIRIVAPDAAAAESQVAEMCRKLLANPVIEDFRYEIAELAPAAP